MTQKTTSWLIYGTGFISCKLAEAIRNTDGNEVYSVVSRDRERGEEFARQHGACVVHNDFTTAIQDPHVDIVYIATPNHLHAESAILALSAGKHVLCEKPLTVNAAECKLVRDYAKQTQKTCLEALMYHYHPVAEKLRQLVSHSPIGKIKTFAASFCDTIFSFANPTAGGSIMDLGCYPVSLILSLVKSHLGQNQSQARLLHAVGQLDESNNTDAFASCQLALSHGIHAVINCSNRYGLNSSFRILGEAGVIEIENPWLAESTNTIHISYFDGRPADEIHVTASESLYAYEVQTMAAIARGETSPTDILTLDQSLEIIDVLDSWRSAIGLRYAVEKGEQCNETIC